jgi:hypothetical protein
MTTHDHLDHAPSDLTGQPGPPQPPSRRRRLVVAALSAAAVVVVTLPIALRGGDLFGGDGTTSPSASTGTTAAPSATTSPSPSGATGAQPAPGVLDVSHLPTGAAPHLEYVTGQKVLHRVDGSTLATGTRYPVSSFVSLRDGSRVWQTAHAGRTYVEVTDATGTLRDPVPSTWGLAVNPRHSAAAWVDPSGQVQVWDVGAARQLALGDPVTGGSELRISTLAGDGCGPGSPSGCTAYVNLSDRQGAWQPWEVTRDGSRPLADGGFLMVADRSTTGLMIGYTRITDNGTCSTLVGAGSVQGFSTCRHTLASFSPDASLVLADPAYHDGIGNGLIGMYDVATGDLLFERHGDQQHQAFYTQAVWEDATHVLAPVFQAGRWAVVRIASDGSLEYAVAPVAGEDVANPFVLAEGGMSYGD